MTYIRRVPLGALAGGPYSHSPNVKFSLHSPKVEVEPDAGEHGLQGDVDLGGQGGGEKVGVRGGGDEAEDDGLGRRPHQQELERVDLEELDEEVVGGVQDAGEGDEHDAELPGVRWRGGGGGAHRVANGGR